uniref:C-type lectin domain-containing protein n=1 Tax=Scleropages formosus TaxID=113540 RepID=A0A8C9STT9_SCLFO
SGTRDREGLRPSSLFILTDTQSKSSRVNILNPVVLSAQGTTNPYILIETYLTWREAQRYCRENYTDLASVRTQVDQQQMKSLVSSTVWIGLFRDPWQWSDQRNSSFRYWAPGKPDNNTGNEKCTVASITQTLSGTWDDRQCETEFCCKFKRS